MTLSILIILVFLSAFDWFKYRNIIRLIAYSIIAFSLYQTQNPTKWVPNWNFEEYAIVTSTPSFAFETEFDSVYRLPFIHDSLSIPILDLDFFQSRLTSDDRITVIGDGLLPNEFSLLETNIHHWIPSKPPMGIIDLSYPSLLYQNERDSLTIKVRNIDPIQSIKLKLDSTQISTFSYTLESEFDAKLKLPLKTIYPGLHTSLIEVHLNDSLLFPTRVGYEVRIPKKHDFLLISSQPSFEFSTLYNWLAKSGQNVRHQVKVSSSIYLTFFNGNQPVTEDRITWWNLPSSHLIIDPKVLESLNQKEFARLKMSLYNGGQLFIFPFSTSNTFKEVLQKLTNVNLPYSPTKEPTIQRPNLTDSSFVTFYSLPKNDPSMWTTKVRSTSNTPLLWSISVGKGRLTLGNWLETHPWILQSRQSAYDEFWITILSHSFSKYTTHLDVPINLTPLSGIDAVTTVAVPEFDSLRLYSPQGIEQSFHTWELPFAEYEKRISWIPKYAGWYHLDYGKQRTSFWIPPDSIVFNLRREERYQSMNFHYKKNASKIEPKFEWKLPNSWILFVILSIAFLTLWFTPKNKN